MGGSRGSGHDIAEVAGWFADEGVAAFVVTRDRPRRDPRRPRPRRAGRDVGRHLDPGDRLGGVGTSDHVEALQRLVSGGRRLAGAIVGRAIYEGTVDLAEALALTGEDRRHA